MDSKKLQGALSIEGPAMAVSSPLKTLGMLALTADALVCGIH